MIDQIDDGHMSITAMTKLAEQSAETDEDRDEMRLWVLSDIHLESCEWDLPPVDQRPDYDVMIVAGDLIPGMDRGVRWLAQRVHDRPVIYVGGNHEGYGTDIDRTVEKARQAALGTNVTVLQDDACVIDDTTFVGATFWTNFDLFGDPPRAMAHAGDVMNDYRRIRRDFHHYRLRSRDTRLRNLASRRFFAEAIANATTEKIVVVTHHCPAAEGAKAGTENDLITAAYVNTGCDDLLAGVDAWFYGHTHETRLFEAHGARVITNAKGRGPPRGGKTWENADFDPFFTIEI